MNRNQRLLLIFIAILAGAAGSMTYRWWSRSQAEKQPPPLAQSQAEIKPAGQAAGAAPAGDAELIGSLRPDYTLGSSEGERISAAEFDGKVVLVNFWATWCAPCREEMPMLAELHGELAGSGFEVVGIALDEVAQARDIATELGIDYPILVGSTDVMTVSQLYGNRSGTLPYSVLLDREGVIRWAYLGELKEAELRQEISGLLSTETLPGGGG
jgi:thiol-disulfide isomerase/thioredoxin